MFQILKCMVIDHKTSSNGNHSTKKFGFSSPFSSGPNVLILRNLSFTKLMLSPSIIVFNLSRFFYFKCM